jgi:hypothetical protein
MHLLGMPLNRQDPGGAGSGLCGLDQPIVGPPAGNEAGREILDSLMMERIHRNGRGFERGGRPAARL